MKDGILNCGFSLVEDCLDFLETYGFLEKPYGITDGGTGDILWK